MTTSARLFVIAAVFMTIAACGGKSPIHPANEAQRSSVREACFKTFDARNVWPTWDDAERKLHLDLWKQDFATLDHSRPPQIAWALLFTGLESPTMLRTLRDYCKAEEKHLHELYPCCEPGDPDYEE
jgi:hypothetical protein